MPRESGEGAFFAATRRKTGDRIDDIPESQSPVYVFIVEPVSEPTTFRKVILANKKQPKIKKSSQVESKGDTPKAIAKLKNTKERFVLNFKPSVTDIVVCVFASCHDASEVLGIRPEYIYGNARGNDPPVWLEAGLKVPTDPNKPLEDHKVLNPQGCWVDFRYKHAWDTYLEKSLRGGTK